MSVAVVASSSRETQCRAEFELFRQEIDEYNDRRERLIKVSRDVTTASKRLIFQLHRFPHNAFQKPVEPESQTDKLIKDSIAKRREIVGIIRKAAEEEGLASGMHQEAQSDVPSVRAQRHDRAYGPGLEEFIEAVSFLHFLQTAGQIISHEEVQDLVRDPSSQQVLLPISTQRYLLGISDLTGELMRFATNALGAGAEGQRVVTTVLHTLRDLAGALDPFIPLVFGLRKKQTVTLQSLRKIEDLSYAVKVRTSEFASDPAALQEMVKRALTGNPHGTKEEEDREEA